jgi:hypothetical protein
MDRNPKKYLLSMCQSTEIRASQARRNKVYIYVYIYIYGIVTPSPGQYYILGYVNTNGEKEVKYDICL